MARPARSLFPPFAGVALADILANSAAIVIIMIVVTLMASHEQEQDKLEQAEDVAVLLSRELATSFVMNALPTSPPARLHDYVTWGPDRNPQHALMPILELHDGFVRDYYTGKVFRREELLRHRTTCHGPSGQSVPRHSPLPAVRPTPAAACRRSECCAGADRVGASRPNLALARVLGGASLA